ncbi:MAG: hypothetical protein LBB22_06615 [Treponema sp.]|jgi:hypothetical protein|nr:hypothetical protein [Treponema sp.]
MLQDLAVQTACLSMYYSAETGIIATSRYDDPPDYYNPPMMANRFYGVRLKTNLELFYGLFVLIRTLCFIGN